MILYLKDFAQDTFFALFRGKLRIYFIPLILLQIKKMLTSLKLCSVCTHINKFRVVITTLSDQYLLHFFVYKYSIFKNDSYYEIQNIHTRLNVNRFLFIARYKQREKFLRVNIVIGCDRIFLFYKVLGIFYL